MDKYRNLELILCHEYFSCFDKSHTLLPQFLYEMLLD